MGGREDRGIHGKHDTPLQSGSNMARRKLTGLRALATLPAVFLRPRAALAS
ncbi:hypothetical protein RR42_s0071 [Cupriavidus basilensis]|uniref:Uncharacterized protein n=1 Tax=Cupriavidus basilensis TaxID=68895 RepID=A0A0C4YIL2_9BURK|nr:hypothetical protein RR42_s0071 [Cupriavidus basilensis]